MENPVDKDWLHLFPQFRTKLQVVLAETEKKTGYHWVLVEGYRSQERQDWLYAQGRTRPGPIVTWVTSPRWHGVGLAADVAPILGKGIWYNAPREIWLSLRDHGKLHELINPAWSKGDLGHLQIGDGRLREQALTWLQDKSWR